MDDIIWQRTVEILQSTDDPLVERPKLTDKLLSKPPFRFLHDVISAVQAKTGFADGLYLEQELDAKSIQDKDGKVAYLTKIINVVSICLNQPVAAKPLKIVAGLEPEHTNAFLQMLGQAAMQSDGTAAVQQVLAIMTPAAASPAPAPTAPAEASGSRRSSSSSRRVTKEEETRRVSKEEEGRRTSREEEARPGSSRSSSRPQQPQQPAAPPQQPQQQRPGTSSTSSRPQQQRPGTSSTSSRPQQPPSADDPPAALPSKPQAAPAPEQPAAAPGELQPPARPQSSRPQSARKAPPKVHNPEAGGGILGRVAAPPPPAAAAAAAASGDRPGTSHGRPGSSQGPTRPGTSSGRPGTTAAAPPAGLFEENRAARRSSGSARAAPGSGTPASAGLGADDDDDDEVEVVQEAARPMGRAGGARARDGQGVLVQDILQAQEELQKLGLDSAAGQKDDSGDQAGGIILKRQPKAGSAAKGAGSDLGAMRDMVQKLCQSSMPLARYVDSLQEDLENMAREQRFWATEKKVYLARLEEGRRAAQEPHSELQAGLADTEGRTAAARERLIGLKAQVLRNEETLEKLLAMVVAGGRRQ